MLDPGVLCHCGNNATHMIELHAVDYCTPARRTATEFRCNDCLERAYRLVGELLSLPNNWCSTCMVTFTEVSDVIITMVPIPRR